MMNERMGWDEYFLTIADLVAKRSTCTRRKVGAVIVRDHQVISTGYNGVPHGVEHCNTAGCLREQMGVPSGEKHELCRGVHAEQNAIIKAAKNGTRIEGAQIYCTTQPCFICAKMIVNAGITDVFCCERYNDPQTIALFESTGILIWWFRGNSGLKSSWKDMKIFVNGVKRKFGAYE